MRSHRQARGGQLHGRVRALADAWVFAGIADWLPAEQLDSYVAGLILLAAAPCTAMVFA